MNLPKLTVVTTSYNQENFIEATIRSVIGQEYPALEYIIVDGGSTDHTVDIIRRYEKHLAWWTSEKDGGMYEGIQKGFARSSGEIMCWINSDDIFHPRSFFVVAELFSKFREVDWVQGIPSAIDEDGRIVGVKKSRRWSKMNFFMKDSDHVQQESVFWRRSLWERAGSTLNTKLKYAGDYELWLRFFDYAQLYSVDTVLGAFRFRSSGQLSREKFGEYRQEAESALAARMEKCTEEERRSLRIIRQYVNRYAAVPLLRSWKYPAYNAAINYPPPITFDRDRMEFSINRKKN